MDPKKTAKYKGSGRSLLPDDVTFATQVTSPIVNVGTLGKLLLGPGLTTTQKNALSSPAKGTVVYDSTLNKLCVRTASAWETITSS